MFKLRFLGIALDDLSRIDRPHQKLIKATLLILVKNPEALKNNIRRIAGADEALYHLRVGSCRIIFRKEEEALVILIIRIGHRKEVYLSHNVPAIPLRSF